MARGFFDIKAWQKAESLAVEVYQMTESFPPHQRYSLTNQMQRASVSVAANIAEGSGRRTVTDDLRFLFIAKGSLRELEYYIHLSKRLGYLSEANYHRLDALPDETARVLTGFIRFQQREASPHNTSSSRLVAGVSSLE
ncbi:four helix bundle protein, partial [Candidatus Poribacteria bacterium]|nr:four helix bundle protein [Candidatus Poribacteria bacterium]